MKTSKMLRAALLLFSLCLMVFTVNTIVAKTKDPVKKATKKKAHKPADVWNFEYTDNSGNEFIVQGIGGNSSGSLSTLQGACIDGVAHTGGTIVSGTYSISDYTATLSNVEITVTNVGTYYYAGATAYGGATTNFSLDCNGGGGGQQ
jgi:hypothetical protein